MPERLFLLKVPLRVDRLSAIARRRGLPIRDLDDGYFTHCVLRELWQERAPAPFVIRGAGRGLDVWGYGGTDAATLVQYAREFADPSLLAAIGDLDTVVSRPMPRLDAGRRLGFLLRACPVVRLSKARNGHRAGAEIDAFLARSFEGGDEAVVSREAVYREWITGRLGRSAASGVTLERVRIAGMSRERLLRRTQGETRQATRLERPDVRFEGDLVVTDGDRLLDYVAHGVGRHRAFGFGALILVPPGTSYPA
jgi:CRISPR system Cascade subunit CasE